MRSKTCTKPNPTKPLKTQPKIIDIVKIVKDSHPILKSCHDQGSATNSKK